MTAESSEGGDSAYAHLPSTKLFTDLVEGARLEVAAHWDAYGGEDEYQVLGLLYMHAAITADDLAGSDRSRNAPQRFHVEWGELDRAFGDPTDRAWLLETREAYRRLTVLTRYLNGSGLLSLREAERNAPERYLSKREKGGAD